jgi:hypothetical protein
MHLSFCKDILRLLCTNACKFPLRLVYTNGNESEILSVKQMLASQFFDLLQFIYLFICSLFNDAVNSSDYKKSNQRKIHEQLIEKDIEEWLWSNLSCYPGICPEVLRKTAKTLSGFQA